MSVQKLKPKWIRAYRLHYKKTLTAPNRIVVHDLRKGTVYTTDHFDLENCKITMAWENAVSDAKRCGAKVELNVWVK